MMIKVAIKESSIKILTLKKVLIVEDIIVMEVDEVLKVSTKNGGVWGWYFGGFWSFFRGGVLWYYLFIYVSRITSWACVGYWTFDLNRVEVRMKFNKYEEIKVKVKGVFKF